MPIHTTARLIRDVRASVFFSEKKRVQWVERLHLLAERRARNAGARVAVRLERRVREGAGGGMLRVVLSTGADAQKLRLKWCPSADPEALDATARNMRWWRDAHPELALGAADLVDYWPDERVLVIAECPGRALGAIAEHAATGASRLGEWFRAYAWGHEYYDEAIESRLGATARRDVNGRLWVHPKPLIESRVSRAERAVYSLRQVGFDVPERAWRVRAAESVLDAHASEERGGFVHGDLKCGNVLANQDRVTVIDWWVAPCVSWPVTDVANFAASAWLGRGRQGGAMWQSFIDAYAPEGIDDRGLRTLGLLASVSVLDYLARRMQETRVRFLERGHVGRILHAMGDARCNIAALIVKSQSPKSNSTVRSNLPVAAGIDE